MNTVAKLITSLEPIKWNNGLCEHKVKDFDTETGGLCPVFRQQNHFH